MKTIIISIAIFLIGGSMFAQNNFESALREIEENITTLKVIKDELDAKKIGNKTGLTPDNPEVEFGYLWGNPSLIGNRTDFNVTQSFDFPTVYSIKSKIAGMQNAQLDLLYKTERINLLLQAKKRCIDVVYYNALIKELEQRLTLASQLADSYKQRLDKGESNILESNKAQMSFANVNREITNARIERAAVLAELKLMNGGIEVVITDTTYILNDLSANFDQWVAAAEQRSPALQYVKSEAELAQRQVKLSKALGLPKFKAGYMSEKVVGERYQGITVGVSIPLWANNNKVKEAKALARVTESKQKEARVQFYGQLQNNYQKTMGLKQASADYKKSLVSLNNTTLLKKALEAGQISLLNYIVEMELFYETVNNSLQAERDFESAYAELSAFEL